MQKKTKAPRAKRARCITEKQVIGAAKRYFEKDEFMNSVAASLDITPSYLARLLAEGRKKKLFKVTVEA